MTPQQQILLLHLKQKYYNMVKNKEKTNEYREYKPYWKNRIKKQTKLILLNGYKNKDQSIQANIKNITIIEYKDLPLHAKNEFIRSKYKKFYNIEFSTKN